MIKTNKHTSHVADFKQKSVSRVSANDVKRLNLSVPQPSYNLLLFNYWFPTLNKWHMAQKLTDTRNCLTTVNNHKLNLWKTWSGYLPQTADLSLSDDLVTSREKWLLNSAIVRVSGRRERRRRSELWRIIFLFWELFPRLLWEKKTKQNPFDYLPNNLIVNRDKLVTGHS